MKNEIILYRPNKITEHIEVKFEEDTVWLSQQQMATLFSHTKQNISLHINNCFKENELDSNSVVKESLTVQKEFHKSHDRFLIIDNAEIFHLGASLKDLGKKWFAFSKMDKNSVSSVINEIIK